METVDVKLPSELLKVATWRRALYPSRQLDCWPSNSIAKTRSLWDARRNFVRHHWRLSWILRRNMAFLRCATASKIWKTNARLLTALKRDRRSRFISAGYPG